MTIDSRDTPHASLHTQASSMDELFVRVVHGLHATMQMNAEVRRAAEEQIQQLPEVPADDAGQE